MSVYSTWNQAAGQFDYWESPTEQPKLNAEKPTHIGTHALGATVDQAAWPLPGNVRKIGAGPEAIGRIATPKRRAGLGDVELVAGITVGKLAVIAGAAYMIRRYVLKGRR